MKRVILVFPGIAAIILLFFLLTDLSATSTSASEDPQPILDYWSDEVYRIYKDTDLTSLIGNIQGREHLNANAVRGLADQAMMHLYYYFRDGKAEDFNKAQYYLEKSIEKYPNWKKVWGSAVTMNQLAFDFWWAWDELSPDLRSRFLGILVEEADFWTWVLNEIKTNPYGSTIPQEAGRKGRQNLSLITTDPSSNDHLNDTRAEENAWNAQFLAAAYSLLPAHPNAQSWNEAAKCFAYHTFSRGESACGITSRTISNDYTLGNHNLWPSPLYTLSGITGLQQGQFSYALAGFPIPQEFLHNIENRMNSGVWRKNITECVDEHYNIKPECHAGADWGDTKLPTASFMLFYWANLQNDNQAREEGERILNYYYSIREPIRFPHQNPVERIEKYIQSGAFAEDVMWLRNLEFHPQFSAKFLALYNYQNQEFRNRFFPQKLKICEEGFFHKKIWEGNLIWSCDSLNKKVGNSSLSLSSNNFSNAEVYSPLIRVNPDKYYKVSYWVKTENLQPDDAQVYGRIVAAQYNQNAKEEDEINQNRIDSGFGLGENVGGTNNWVKKSYAFKTNSETRFVRLRAPIGLLGKAKGRVWYDEVKIEETVPTQTPTPTPTPPPSLSLSSGWNQITWLNISGYTAKTALEDIDNDCGAGTALTISRKRKDWWEDWIKNYGGGDFGLQNNQNYFINVSKGCNWMP